MDLQPSIAAVIFQVYPDSDKSETPISNPNRTDTTLEYSSALPHNNKASEMFVNVLCIQDITPLKSERA